MISLAFGLDSFEQFDVGALELAGKFHGFVQSPGIYLEPLSQLFGSGIVKE